MSHSSILLRTLALSALAVACHSALAADIDASVIAAAREGGRVETLIVLADQARPALAPLATDADYRVRRRVLVDALQARAEAQQADLRDWLDARGIEYRPYWIANVLWARLSANELQQLSARSEIDRITANPSFPLQMPEQADLDAPSAPEAIEWGVQKINAPLVWAEGFTGQGVVIAGQDTGYQWDHPALINQYRGWDGATATHDYNWHDSIHAGGNPCGSDSPEPCDDNGHGTHTAGTFAGTDGGANQIGVAPGAKWIGCRNMASGVGTPARYIECMEWFLAPTDMNGANPDPDRAPDVINNSWGCPQDAPPIGEGCTPEDILESAVGNLVAGGILFVASAGNDGSGCGSILTPPAIYDASFVVGSTTISDDMSGFSSRGPVSGSGLIRPDVSAPGSNIRSSFPGNSYGSISGTSMAGPHVAGAAALLMSVDPALKGHPDQVAQLLRDSAAHIGLTQSCGGIGADEWPNYVAGHGRIDVYAAAQLVLQGAAPTLGKEFSPASVEANSPSMLTVTLANTDGTAATLSAALVDTFPAGLVIADPAMAATTCTNGSVTANAGDGSLELSSGAEIPANGSCTVTVAVASAAVGSYENILSIGALQTDAGDNADAAAATLTVTLVDSIFEDGFDGAGGN